MIVGELINSSRKAIRPAIKDYDANAIIALAKKQEMAGADYLDINCGSFTLDEPDRLVWLTNVIKEATKLPLCLDSPNVNALTAALPLINDRPILVNSITAEKSRFESILPLVQQYRTGIIALCMSDKGIAKTTEDRIRIVDKLVNDLVKSDVPVEKIYLDPMVQPVATTFNAAKPIFETVRYVKKEYPGIHCICGLSNVSFGLPNRQLINRYFLSQIIAFGMDSFILNPTDQLLMGAYYVSKTLTGEDKFCVEYLKKYRNGLYADSFNYS